MGRLEAPGTCWIGLEAVTASSLTPKGSKNTDEAEVMFSGVNVWIVASARESSQALSRGLPLERVSTNMVLSASGEIEFALGFSSDILSTGKQLITNELNEKVLRQFGNQ